MYSLVKEISIEPIEAWSFITKAKSSTVNVNSTFVLWIIEGDYNEKVGNVTVHAELAAFNQNFSTFLKMKHSDREREWRWRTAIYRFNLTVKHP